MHTKLNYKLTKHPRLGPWSHGRIWSQCRIFTRYFTRRTAALNERRVGRDATVIYSSLFCDASICDPSLRSIIIPTSRLRLLSSKGTKQRQRNSIPSLNLNGSSQSSPRAHQFPLSLGPTSCSRPTVPEIKCQATRAYCSWRTQRTILGMCGVTYRKRQPRHRGRDFDLIEVLS